MPLSGCYTERSLHSPHPLATPLKVCGGWNWKNGRWKGFELGLTIILGLLGAFDRQGWKMFVMSCKPPISQSATDKWVIGTKLEIFAFKKQNPSKSP